jgi:hypothetical protein
MQSAKILDRFQCLIYRLKLFETNFMQRKQKYAPYAVTDLEINISFALNVFLRFK